MRVRSGSLLCAAALGGALLGGACGADSAGDAGATVTTVPSAATTTTTRPPQPDDAAFAGPGPYPVGVTTLDLEGRSVEVFYPASPGSESGLLRDSYSTSDALPPDMRAAPTGAGVDQSDGGESSASVPAIEIPAYRDLPSSDEGPFPVLLFSHGFGGWRLTQSSLTAGIASWGFVVASIDHTERGLVSLVAGTARADADAEAEVDLATLDLIHAESRATEGILSGAAAPDRTAAAGHSAGGATALALMNEARIDAIVAWAPAPRPEYEPFDTPTMVIAAERDVAITPEVARIPYDAASGPKAFVVIGRAGHNSFTDVCLQMRQGLDVLGAARLRGLAVPEVFARLATNGCSTDDLDPREAWAITQHFTVAYLRSVFAPDGDGVPDVGDAGLGDAVTDAFDGTPVFYAHTP